MNARILIVSPLPEATYGESSAVLLTIVVAFTSNLRVATLPVGVLLRAGEGGLVHDCAAHCGHVYTVDKKRLRTRVGQLTLTRMAEVDRALISSLGL
jgi:mRNA interferase MazF